MHSAMSFLLLFSLCFLIHCFVFLLIKKKKAKTMDAKTVPPGPKKLPIIGNLHQLGKLPHRSLRCLSNEYGPLMLMQLGSVPALVVSSADTAREVFKRHDLAFSGRPAFYVAKKLTYDYSDITLAPYGEYWREVKKILVLELLSAKKVQSFEAIRDEEVARMVNFIARSSNPVNLSRLALSLSNNVICRIAFGKISGYEDGSEAKSKFEDIFHETEDFFGTVNIADFFPALSWINKFNGVETRLKENFKKLDSFLNQVIEEHLDSRRSKTEKEDIVDALLRIQGNPNETITLSSENIKGILVTVLLGGSDTSTAVLVWTMAELMRNPMVRRKAQQEVREIIKGQGKVGESDLSRLEYLKLIIKESLRLHPPGPLLIPRETIECCTIEGYKIPAKTRVFINAAAIATDSKVWENPYAFKPERFMDKTVDFKGEDFEMLPFGAGRRGCPGMNFAVPLIGLALANLLLQFDWKLPEGMIAEDLEMEEAPGITVHKKIPLCLVASPNRCAAQD
uniref:Strychnine-11-hydroxylase n=1 Tax=Strychnos nux-vomica TaxID=28545 RepID=11H_STRNX|nr:strychnine-11-hydroxylase [Strychnos nux-vomica]